jgi:hypothetical protein
MEGATLREIKKFSSLEEEVAYLRAKIHEKDQDILHEGGALNQSEIIAGQLRDYQKEDKSRVLDSNFAIGAVEQEAIVLELKPKETDAQIGELLGMLTTKGLLNTLSIVEELNNPLLQDDFHRFLVQYIKTGHELRGVKEKDPHFKSLKMTLFEIALPEGEKDDNERRGFKELVSSMEQFYLGMLSVGNATDNDIYTLEVAVPNNTQDVIFFAAIPESQSSLFEKQILSIFPKAKITEQKEDYNIFTDASFSTGSYASYDKNPIFPVKLADQFEYDPLNVILNAFSQIAKNGEGAAMQIIINPKSREFTEKYKHALNEISQGVKVKDAIDIRTTSLGIFAKEAKLFFKEVSDKKEEEKKESEKDRTAVENIKKKILSPTVEINLRLITSAQSLSRAEAILSEIEASFNQFEDPQSNSLKFLRYKKSTLKKFITRYAFRLFDADELLPISLRELMTVFHFPSIGVIETPGLKQSKSTTAPAPTSFDSGGIFLGTNLHRNNESDIYMSPADRLRHFYVIGQTGTGKSNFLKNMIIQDIHRGEGVCLIDPHGSDIIDVLATVPKERYEDVIYFDPSYTSRPMGLNMLEFDPHFPEQKTFVVNELMSIFRKLFGAVPESMGPAFEQYFRNSALLVMADPQSGCTLIEVGRVISDKPFRDMKLAKCKDPIIAQFWRNAEDTKGEQDLANFAQYVTNKFDVFTTNEIMRPIIAQEHSSFNFREIMDTKKILLVNLSKGRLGDINANLIGLVIVGKILMAALSRVDSIGKDLPPFYLYIDEFQNITTDSIATILSEARKYKLSLTMAHQFIAQLEDNIKDAVFGNVGSIATFRVGADDAEYLEKQFSPVFTAKDIMNIENYNAYLKILVNGTPERPFNIKTAASPAGDMGIVDSLRELSYLRFGRDREEVEANIFNRYSK